MRSTAARLLACFAVLSLLAPGCGAEHDPLWTRLFPPFRIVGNVYWVGSYDLSSYLIQTPAGHILINTGIGDTARRIEASIEELGFDPKDVKILTCTHAHFDHVAGLAELKKKTKAAVAAHEEEKPLLESGGRTDFLMGKTRATRFDPVKVDWTFEDGDPIALGGVVLTAHHHPGHTKGATSFSLDVEEGGKTYRVVIANMPSINPGVDLTGMPGYPEIAADYAATFTAQRAMKVDVWLASHASQFDLHDKVDRKDRQGAERFVDPDGYRSAVERLEGKYREQLASDRARGAGKPATGG